MDEPITENQKRFIIEMERAYRARELTDDWSGLTKQDGELWIRILQFELGIETKA